MGMTYFGINTRYTNCNARTITTCGCHESCIPIQSLYSLYPHRHHITHSIMMFVEASRLNYTGIISLIIVESPTHPSPPRVVQHSCTHHTTAATTAAAAAPHGGTRPVHLLQVVCSKRSGRPFARPADSYFKCKSVRVRTQFALL